MICRLCRVFAGCMWIIAYTFDGEDMEDVLVRFGTSFFSLCPSSPLEVSSTRMLLI